MLTLVSFDLCPYVQRAAIALAEKGIPFERRDVDLADKPGWFKAISPLGKVPLLQVDGEVLFESAVIVEYLDETRGPKLHPQDALVRARHRAWMEFGSSILADIWTVETTPDQATFQAKARILREKFVRLEGELGVGPWFTGERFSLVDAVFAPAFRYFDVFDRFIDLGVFEGLPKVQTWRQALAARPSVRDAVAADYEARLEAFLRRQPSWLARHLH
ncbi:MAG: glutathione S-transferase family protein [Reyranella sp.]|uniref:glutathione S-transferase family protein n=1 Tax=Reyranella sp. TaxID=1929291 RepID=UPI001229C6E2|nr:glutathione S-transferase family protein [Reyranella sp.]TAJ90297.1 MAG: glutathione S-transferase family protein [Reyranella sp.]TBR28926.1 MAG: glutathione S-transferase family protein [Reyranella sp.]